MLFDIWKPAVFHGRNPGNQFFEGWYFKLISADQKQRFAVIPGIFTHPDPNHRHAFIQILNGITHQVIYHRFPVDAFSGSKSKFEVKIAKNFFSSEGLELNIENENQTVKGRVDNGRLASWPITLLSPGVMGPFRFVPFMQTYHGVLSMDHGLDGMLEVDGKRIEFSKGRGYIEKDWGRTFPRAYIWMQSNHFSEEETSLMGSVATIPWMGDWFRGFLVGLYHQGILYRFTTYLGAKISQLVVNDDHVIWVLTGKRKTDPNRKYPGYELRIIAKRGEGGLLSSPELDGMTPRILESLNADIEVTLRALDNSGKPRRIIFEGKGDCGGLEVAGSIHELTDNEAEKSL